MLLILVCQMIDLSFLYLPDKIFFFIFERWNFFIIIRVYMHWSYVFALCLLINDYKNICSHNVCVWWFFIRIISMKRGYRVIFVRIVSSKSHFLVWKDIMEMIIFIWIVFNAQKVLWEYFLDLWVCFFNVTIF